MPFSLRRETLQPLPQSLNFRCPLLVWHFDARLRMCKTQDGRTALIGAAEEGYTDCVCVLLEGRADTEGTDNVRDAV